MIEKEVVLSKELIAGRVSELGKAISHDYDGQSVVMI